MPPTAKLELFGSMPTLFFNYNFKDINTVDTTDSGNLHGCPVSFLMGLGKKLESFKWLKPCLETTQIVYIGLRDVDDAEKKILKDHNIKAFSMYSIDKFSFLKLGMELARLWKWL